MHVKGSASINSNQQHFEDGLQHFRGAHGAGTSLDAKLLGDVATLMQMHIVHADACMCLDHPRTANYTGGC